MSFSEMMSSGRGPGVIGMLMAAFVLVGFGILFVFAFDEGMQGGERTIESVLAEQLRQINTNQEMIRNGTAHLDEASDRRAIAADLTRVKRQLLDQENQLKVLSTDLEKVQSTVKEQTETFASYQDQYREHVMALAEDREMEELQTTDGTVYHQVRIREVTAIGIQIWHRDGQKRIGYENLPADMIDHFQFSKEQKDAAMQKESMMHQVHEEAVAAAEQAAALKLNEQEQMKTAADRERKVQEITLKGRQVSLLEREVVGFEGEIQRANADAIAAKAAGRMRMNSTGAIERKIAAKKSQIATLRATIVRLKASL